MNCQVKDPRYGYVYDLAPLGGKDKKVSTNEYDYYFRVCGGLTEGICRQPRRNTDVVSSCQIKTQSPSFKKIAGKVTLGSTELIVGEYFFWLHRDGYLVYQDVFQEQMSEIYLYCKATSAYSCFL